MEPGPAELGWPVTGRWLPQRWRNPEGRSSRPRQTHPARCLPAACSARGMALRRGEALSALASGSGGGQPCAQACWGRGSPQGRLSKGWAGGL